jgi:anti-sigma B factor antagonist
VSVVDERPAADPTPRFNVTAGHDEHGQVVQLVGDLDVDAAPLLRRWLDAFEATGRVVELDMSGLTFLDSTGLGCLYKLHHKVTDAGGIVVAPRPPAPIRRILEISGLNRVIALTD